MGSMTPTLQGFIDLHIHSNCSDGAFSATELVDQAIVQELTTIAIADHDSVASVATGIAAANLAGIENIPAVELSVQYKSFQDVHLLGYGFDHTDRGFCEKLDLLREKREHRNEEVLARVNERLAHEGRARIELSHVLVYAKGVIGRPHIARALLEHGYVKSVEDAFRRYLVPCNVPKHYWPVAEAISEIRHLGGLAVLAHPTTITSDHQELWRIITELAEIGLDGIEAFNNLALADDMEFLKRRAGEAGLLLTGGSDFHGIEAGLELGRGRGGIRFSASLLSPIRERLSERRKYDREYNRNRASLSNC
ncbi:MAG: PHP domain-containing protein [Desulfuromonadales bacterium]|nr:PHP domain-containing protein [Desulfuromonadales bacterium]